MTAILIIPLIGAAGMAIDIGRAMTMRSDLMGIADAAALGAVAEGTAGYRAVQKMTRDGEVTLAQDDGRQIFLAQRGVAGGENLYQLPLDISIKVIRQNGVVTSAVSFKVEMPTTFMSILGTNTMSVGGSVSAAYEAQSKSYTNFYMLLDNTPSMGIAATMKDMERLRQLTSADGGRGCELACHAGWYGRDGKFNENPNSTYIVARKNNIPLRVDVVAKAAETLVNKVRSQMASVADQYRIAAYSFGRYAIAPGYRIERLTSLTVDTASASKAVGDMALMTTDHDHFNHNALTSFDTALTEIGREISGKGGSGANSGDPQKIVYFVTDGVGDSLKAGGTCGGSWYENDGRCLEPIDTKYCTALKNREIKIAVLYTTYIPLTGDNIWERHMKNVFASQIRTKLEECASEDLFFEVGPDDDMQAAMTQLFVRAASSSKSLRLTN